MCSSRKSQLRVNNRVMLFRQLALTLLIAASPVVHSQLIEQALKTGDNTAALTMTRSALQAKPGDARLHTLEGIALSRLGKSKDALVAYQSALKTNSNYLPALEGAAEIEYQAKSASATGLLTRIVALQPNDQTAHAMLGAIAFGRKDCPVAVNHFRQSAQLIATNVSALQQDGVCHLRMKNLNLAIADFERVLSLQPDDAGTRRNLAGMYLSGKKPQSALDVLKPLVTADPPDPEALAQSAEAHEALGNTPDAVASLRQAIVLRPDDEEFYLDFATLSFAHNSFDAGVAMLNAGLLRLPKSARLFLARGILYIQKGEYDKGEADFETANQLDPSQAFVPDVQVMAKMESKQGGGALPKARAQVKQHPKDAFLQALLAENLLESGASPGSPEFNEAREAAQRAIALNPNLGYAHNILGGLYLKEGKLPLAAKECRAALQIDSADQVALYHLVQALRRSNQSQEIPALLKKLSELRADARKKEAETNRYKLVEQPPDTK